MKPATSHSVGADSGRAPGVPLPRTTHKASARVGTPTDSYGRDIEWLSSTIMCAYSLVLALPGDSMAGPAFVQFHRFGLTETFWACAFGVMGGLRLAALYVNGRSPRTPFARMIGAFFGFIMWGEVALLLFQGAMLEWGAVSPGVAVYSVLALAELRSLFRASYDARYIAR